MNIVNLKSSQMRSLVRRVGRAMLSSFGNGEVQKATTRRSSQPNLDWFLLQTRASDQIRQHQIELMDKYFNESSVAEVDSILRYFSIWPEKTRLIAASDYFFNANPRSVSLRLAALAGSYALGNLPRADIIADDLLTLWDTDTAWALKARTAGRNQGRAAAQDVLKAGLKRHPENYLLQLMQIRDAIDEGEVDIANAFIKRVEEQIRADLADEISISEDAQRDLNIALTEDRLFIPDERDIYTDDFCKSMWLSYFESFNKRNMHQHGDALKLDCYARMIDEVASRTNVVLDFGAACAEPLYRAAQKYPHIQFYGVDRQALLRKLNEEAYPLPNLRFRDGDVFDTVREVANQSGLKTLIHMRTSAVIYPALMRKLYAECKSAGFEHILMLESAGMSRIDFRFRDFDRMTETAVVIKNKVFLHNYKRLLFDAGYDVVHVTRPPATTLWLARDPAAYCASQYHVIARAKP